MRKLKTAPRIVAPYTHMMCVHVYVCDLDGRYHATTCIYRKGMFAFFDPSGAHHKIATGASCV